MNLAAVYQRALARHREGELAHAEWLYRGIVAEQPGHFGALHMLGVVAGQNGAWAESVDWLQQAAAAGDAGPAERAALHRHLGNSLHALGRFEEALASQGQALALEPGHPGALQSRGDCLRALGRAAESARAYRDAAAAGADAQRIGYLLASLGEAPLPAAAPPRYVGELFDAHAAGFEARLVGSLQYRTPALLQAALAQVHAGPWGDALDLGCGTGLCGAWMRPLARRLVGVDLSPRMLDEARQKQLDGRPVYDELVCAELMDFLRGCEAGADAVVAADVLVYLGDLAPVFAAVAVALRPGGVFALSAEVSDAEPVRLGPALRYAHSAAHLRDAAEAAGLDVVHLTQDTLRQEAGAPVRGHLAVLRRRPA